MILTCRVRVSRGRYFEITEADNRFAESRFLLFRDASFPICVYIRVLRAHIHDAFLTRAAVLKLTLFRSEFRREIKGEEFNTQLSH